MNSRARELHWGTHTSTNIAQHTYKQLKACKGKKNQSKQSDCLPFSSDYVNMEKELLTTPTDDTIAWFCQMEHQDAVLQKSALWT